MDKRLNFYKKIVQKILLNKNCTILIIAGGTRDIQVFEEIGFLNVTLSNLAARKPEALPSHYNWSHENAESLNFDDNSFDYVVIHEALHHCSNPHKALTEMYRVSKKGLLAFEARDSFLNRLLVKLKITPDYEVEGIYYHDKGLSGGVNNTPVPNFIYRWTENEIEKTIKSYAPHGNLFTKYFYSYDLPANPSLKKNLLKRIIIGISVPIFVVFKTIFPKQQNLFAFFIKKIDITKNLFPWLTINSENKIDFNHEWAKLKFNKSSKRI